MKKAGGLKKVLLGLALVAGSGLGALPSWGAVPQYTPQPINIGGDGTLVSPTDASIGGTLLFGINNRGEIVGSYRDATTSQLNGFLLTPDAQGKYVTNPLILTAPNASTTWGESVNNKGQIAGGFDDAVTGTQRGFIYDRTTQQYTVYDAPAPSGFTVTQTFIDHINDNGDFSGHYFDDQDAVQHGFMVKGGVFSIMSVPDGSGGYQWTDFDVLTTGNVRGGHYRTYYTRPDGTEDWLVHGFVSYDGVNFISKDTPGYDETELERLNSLLQGIGYLSGNGSSRAFFLTDPAAIPVAIQFLPTSLLNPADWLNSWGEGINDDGAIVGYYADQDGVKYGYLAVPTSVPEPSTFLLTGAGIAGLGCLARRRSRKG